MGKNSLLLIGGIVAAVYFFSKPSVSIGNEGVGGGFSVPNYGDGRGQITPAGGYDITGDAPKAQSLVPLVSTSMNGMPSSSRIASIEKESAAYKSSGKVIYYPDVGVVTKSGLGYSTATPERYTSPTKTILSTTQTQKAVTTGAVFVAPKQLVSEKPKPIFNK